MIYTLRVQYKYIYTNIIMVWARTKLCKIVWHDIHDPHEYSLATNWQCDKELIFCIPGQYYVLLHSFQFGMSLLN